MKMKRESRATALGGLTVGLALGIVASVAWGAAQQAPERGFAWKDGAEVYTKVCALCHETQMGPPLRGRGLDQLYIALIVRNGSRAMPAFREAEIDDQTLKKLAAYVSKQEADK